MKQESSPESSSDSSDSNSDFSSEDGSSDVSDLDKFKEAYEEFGKLTAGVDTMALDRHLAGNKSDDVPGLSLEGGLATLQTLANVSILRRCTQFWWQMRVSTGWRYKTLR